VAVDVHFLDEYIARLKKDLAHYRAELTLWESGSVTTSRRNAAGQWEDQSPAHIAFLKDAVETYEGLLRKHEQAALGKIPVYGTTPVKDA
jgi:hypothetical protein